MGPLRTPVPSPPDPMPMGSMQVGYHPIEDKEGVKTPAAAPKRTISNRSTWLTKSHGLTMFDSSHKDDDDDHHTTLTGMFAAMHVTPPHIPRFFGNSDSDANAKAP